jgi:putative SOS response-associated peptidase YedK
MCNLYRIEKNPDAIRRLFAEVQIPLTFPEGIPNFQPRDVRISESAPIVRWNADSGVAELVERRWSWPASGGKPVFNMRSDGR